MPISCYAAKTAKSALVPYQYEPEGLKPYEIEVDVTHCGICHSDIHLIDNDWGFSTYPLIPGHEVVGTISQVGNKAGRLKRGMRVGIGWQCGACMECEWCIRGEEQLCTQNQATCVGHAGGYAEKIRVDRRFAFVIPENLSSENAAPLLCGGITVYSPLRVYDVKAPMKVGVIGIGGLGHLALQFVRAFGCEVTAFSSSENKEAEAKKFGAHHFVLSSDKKQMKNATASLDVILSTVSADIDWQSYFNILRPKGKIIVLGASPSPIAVPPFVLIGGQKSIVGSAIGGRAMISEMLEFAARHQIKAQTETMPMSEANAALDKVRKNQARYRMVLTNA